MADHISYDIALRLAGRLIVNVATGPAADSSRNSLTRRTIPTGF